ncbi:MAG: hypothetical protein ABIQ53_13480 [Terracoccus sp.]
MSDRHGGWDLSSDEAADRGNQAGALVPRSATPGTPVVVIRIMGAKITMMHRSRDVTSWDSSTLQTWFVSVARSWRSWVSPADLCTDRRETP